MGKSNETVSSLQNNIGSKIKKLEEKLNVNQLQIKKFDALITYNSSATKPQEKTVTSIPVIEDTIQKTPKKNIPADEPAIEKTVSPTPQKITVAEKPVSDKKIEATPQKYIEVNEPILDHTMFTKPIYNNTVEDEPEIDKIIKTTPRDELESNESVTDNQFDKSKMVHKQSSFIETEHITQRRSIVIEAES